MILYICLFEIEVLVLHLRLSCLGSPGAGVREILPQYPALIKLFSSFILCQFSILQFHTYLYFNHEHFSLSVCVEVILFVCFVFFSLPRQVSDLAGLLPHSLQECSEHRHVTPHQVYLTVLKLLSQYVDQIGFIL